MPTATKWSDDQFLDDLRARSDARADTCVAQLGDSGTYMALFRTMDANGGALPPGAPQPLADFFAASQGIPRAETDQQRFPDGVDHERMARGKEVFLSHATVGCLVLLAKALPEGYAAPCLSQILSLSGNLKHHPFRRLLGVLEMVVTVMTPGAFAPDGQAVIIARQIRLMHSGIRRFAREQWTGYSTYTARYGLPVNLEDMLATIMGFSYLVITGLQTLDASVSDAHAEDYYYVWRVYAQLMGIHPPDNRDSSEWVPASLAEAGEFYAAYVRRHYTDAGHNPEGVLLARENLDMLEYLTPKGLRHLGLEEAPRYYMTELIGPVGCARVGLEPVRGYPLTKWGLEFALRAWVAFWNLVDGFAIGRDIHDAISRALLRHVIVKGDGGTITFLIPDDLKSIRELAQRGG
jgi:hypothetical protein